MTSDVGSARSGNADPLLLALTGPVGSGVSTVSYILEKEGFSRLSLSGAIKEEYQRRQGDPSTLPFEQAWRNELQNIGDEMRRSDPAHWVRTALGEMELGGLVVVDGIRNLAEIEWLRMRYSPCYLMAVVAPREARWARLAATYDKDLKAFERDDQRDADEELTYGQQVEKCVQAADYVLWNADELKPEGIREQALLERLRPDIDLMRGGVPRYPFDAETYMASAYATSHSSRCLKRFVGAVIVSRDGVPLSLGYNENPIGMKACETEYRYCYKDAHMDARLEELDNIHCPDCGQAHSNLKSPWRCSECGANLKLRLFPSRNMELCTAIHAEERAIRSLEGRDANGASMYVTTFPCFQCSRYIVDAGIQKVVYVEAYPVPEARDFLEANGVAVEPFEGFKARAFNRIFRQRD